MIERDIVAQKMKEFQIQEYVGVNLRNGGYSHIKLQRTPLGEKIIVYASRPGLVVGRQGSNIRKLTTELKAKFGLENPQIEVGEVDNINLDPHIVGEMIAASLERFGTQRFKGIMHKTLSNVMDAGALGIEIIVSGKIPSARAKSWRVYAGYLKKCGDISVQGVKEAHVVAKLKTGIVGIKIKIMPPDLVLPDKVTFRSDLEIIEEIKRDEAVVEKARVAAEDKKAAKPKGKKASASGEKKAAKPRAKKAPAAKAEKPAKADETEGAE
jgi:small subunit ribosomal protein S3